MHPASIQDLPNELSQEILFKLTAHSVLDACKLFPGVCDLNFWATKANRDFGISKEYFYLPLNTIGGFGTFQEVPVLKLVNWDYTKLTFGKSSELRLDRGAFRYFQIANRFSLLRTAMCGTNRNEYGFIESPMFYVQADRLNQLDLIPSLSSFSSPDFFSYTSVIFKSLPDLSPEFCSLYRLGVQSSHFRHSIAEQIFSPQFVVAMTSTEQKWLKETQGISNGVIPSELLKQLSRRIDDHDQAYKLRSIVEEIIEMGDERLLPAVSGTIDNLIKFYPNSGPVLLYSAIRGGNMKIIGEVLKHGDFFNGIDPDSGEPYCDSYTFDRASYFSGDFEIIRYVCGKCPALFSLGKMNDDQIESFIRGYRYHHQPERFLECLTHFSSILSNEQVSFLCSLKDCDIISHLLEVSIAQSELTMAETAQKFIEANFYCFIGHLDLIAWALRVVKKLFIGSSVPKFKLTVRREVDKNQEERYDYVWEEDDKFLEALGNKCQTSSEMFRQGLKKIN